jgi:putative ABC transport system permease protein
MIGLSLHNLGRRKTRTLLLVVAVAIGSAVAFAGAVVLRSIDTSMAMGFSRLGADLMVVDADALTNITAALLTVEPTDHTVGADLFDRASVPGIAEAAPQRIFRAEHSGFGSHGDSVDLIGFDPDHDFTIGPWIAERLARPMQPGDVILGAQRDLPLGSEIQLFGEPFRVYARLARTGVGTHERAIFMPSDTLIALGPAIRRHTGALPPMLDPARVSGFLVQVAPGATDLQVKFALLSRFPEIAVVSGASLLTGIRQGLSALFGGMLTLTTAMFASLAIMVGVLFSAMVTERRRELGLLKAIGARRAQIARMIVGEAMIATGAGGIIGVGLGIVLLRAFERSLVYHLTEMGVPFLWPEPAFAVLAGIACVLASLLIGAAGAVAPAWRASRRDAYELIRAEG